MSWFKRKKKQKAPKYSCRERAFSVPTGKAAIRWLYRPDFLGGVDPDGIWFPHHTKPYVYYYWVRFFLEDAMC
ncbi:hypothetical protein THOKLE011_41180 [Klebsiella michiganensis]|nr:hypothetical protein THOKLE011_41180 [Klebsiella michiganensis]